MLPGNVQQEVITAFLTDIFYKHIFHNFFYKFHFRTICVCRKTKRLNSIYAYETEENSVIVKVHVIV